MVSALKKVAIPFAVTAASSSLGVGGYGITTYLNEAAEQKQLDEKYGENSKIFASYIKKTEETDSNYKLLCQKWITNINSEKMDVIPEIECNNKFQELLKENRQLEEWLETDYNKFDGVFGQYFDPLPEDIEQTMNKDYEGNWKRNNLTCNNKKNSGKVIVACFKEDPRIATTT
ncbi:similar to tape measure protein [Mycoplasma suis KI3806]|uniref:Similar to tape measure protein n=1 Tax=Mycoplasma suis (strain KI_3806) TaxID=708248 RepID=F0V309_MYCS3|nr:hypothetical protein [Mycoplasma suis]CBZ40231.1 similar to tape measure protein [Mycoplasma suis KI3806]